MGIGVGHLYFFLDDVYPRTRAGPPRNRYSSAIITSTRSSTSRQATIE